MSPKDLEFHTETGRLALDWIATLGDRHGNSIERLNGPDDLIRWLRDVAGQNVSPNPTRSDLAEAKRLRASIAGLLDALYSGKSPLDHDIDSVNEFAAISSHPKRLATSGKELEKCSAPTTSCVLGIIARDAIDLITGNDFTRMRLCAENDCSVYFVDHSRPGRRRWCSMSRCGNKAKKKTFIARRA